MRNLILREYLSVFDQFYEEQESYLLFIAINNLVTHAAYPKYFAIWVLVSISAIV